MKQTALEWLVNEMPVIDWQVPYWKIKLDKAKAMEKEQIMQSVNDGKLMALGTMENKSLEKYYNEKFNTNEK